jgi:hypothetical protein
LLHTGPLLGDPNNGGAPVAHTTGRREINWDGVPEELAAPTFIPGDFFNATTDPRARGALLATVISSASNGSAVVPVNTQSPNCLMWRV